jgi:hypothetical protein
MRRSDAPAARPEVILHHTPTCWLAEFRGPIAEDMKDSVGSETVPTGFNGHVPACVVRQAIALLNPDASVTVAGAPTSAALVPAPIPVKTSGRKRRQESPAPMEAERRISPHLERALKIRRSLGMVVASRYLKKRGWTFEAAHRVLLATWPRKLEACVPQASESDAAPTKVRAREPRVVAALKS